LDCATDRFRKVSSIHFIPIPEGHSGLRARKTKRGRRAAPPTISARLGSHVSLEAHTSGHIIACFGGHSVDLGAFSAAAAASAQDLRSGWPVAPVSSGDRNIDKEIYVLVRRLARRGLLEYSLSNSRNDEDQVVIEPQVADYWPKNPPLGNTDVLALSRFAYMRRRGNDMVLESPRAGALFRICNPKIAAAIAALSTPQQIRRFRRQDGFPGIELLALLVDCQILFKTEATTDRGPRLAEGDQNLFLWDFHDLLFHARSTEGRHANPLGGLYPYAGVVAPLPAVRPRWPGKKIALHKFSVAHSKTISRVEKILHERHSSRTFDDQSPITLAELSRVLDSVARVLSTWKSNLGFGGPVVEYAVKPYPSAGASYSLELYLAVDKCKGLARGFYHYDAGGHALVPITARTHDLEALLTGAKFAMDAPAVPQVLITIAARFGRISWKYCSHAYALLLKDVGVLTQTLYLIATDMGLGGCAIGTTNIDLFARMTGIEFHVEGAVGQFALGRSNLRFQGVKRT
jgi:SagB-type dehydrogenase family enzyme